MRESLEKQRGKKKKKKVQSGLNPRLPEEMDLDLPSKVKCNYELIDHYSFECLAACALSL